MDFFSTSLTLIQRRNNVVCPVVNGPCRECGHDMSVTVIPHQYSGGGGELEFLNRTNYLFHFLLAKLYFFHFLKICFLCTKLDTKLYT